MEELQTFKYLRISRVQWRGQELVRRDSRLPGKNQLAPAATVIKCWQLSMVLKSTAISLNGE